MAKLFLINRSFKHGRETGVREKTYYQIVATRASDLEKANFVIDFEPFPHYVYYPSPENIWKKIEVYGRYHTFFKMIMSRLEFNLRSFFYNYITDDNYRHRFNNKLKQDNLSGKSTPETMIYSRLRKAYYYFILDCLVRYRQVIGLYGKVDALVKVAIAEDLPLQGVSLKVSTKIAGKSYNQVVPAEKYPQFFQSLIQEIIDTKSHFENLKVSAVNISLAHPQEILVPAGYEMEKRKKQLDNYYKVAEHLALLVKTGKLLDFMRQQGVEPVLLQQKVGGKTIKGKSRGEKLWTSYSASQNIYRLLKKMGFGISESREIWERVNMDFNILPNPF